MLTDAQKAVLQLVVQANPIPEYMTQLRDSDDFAISEIANFKEQRSAFITREKGFHQTIIDNFNNELTILEAV